MSDTVTAQPAEPERSAIDALEHPILLEFGASWCGHCRAAQPLIATALASHPGLAHRRIEDGPGKRLGRSFRVKLWPTLILVHRGVELARLVRPGSSDEITAALACLNKA